VEYPLLWLIEVFGAVATLEEIIGFGAGIGVNGVLIVLAEGTFPAVLPKVKPPPDDPDKDPPNEKPELPLTEELPKLKVVTGLAVAGKQGAPNTLNPLSTRVLNGVAN
jgi:hypothetical protein